MWTNSISIGCSIWICWIINSIDNWWMIFIKNGCAKKEIYETIWWRTVLVCQCQRNESGQSKHNVSISILEQVDRSFVHLINSIIYMYISWEHISWGQHVKMWSGCDGVLLPKGLASIKKRWKRDPLFSSSLFLFTFRKDQS